MTELEKIEYAKNWLPTVEQALSLATMTVEEPEFIFATDPEPVKIPLADGYRKALQVLASAYIEQRSVSALYSKDYVDKEEWLRHMHFEDQDLKEKTE